jgi:hypothetical protein
MHKQAIHQRGQLRSNVDIRGHKKPHLETFADVSPPLQTAPFSANIFLKAMLHATSCTIHATCWGPGLAPALTEQRLFKCCCECVKCELQNKQLLMQLHVWVVLLHGELTLQLGA